MSAAISGNAGSAKPRMSLTLIRATGLRQNLTPISGPRKSSRMIATVSRPAPTDHPALAALLSRPTPAVMGVLNITPDSFSDGGRFLAPDRALSQAERMIDEGADIIDIGAESSRPYGSPRPVSAAEELQRLELSGEILVMRCLVVG